MIVHICQIGFRFVAHVAFDLRPFWLFTGIVKSGNSVGIVSANTIDQRFDRAQRAFMENEVTGYYVHWMQRTIDQFTVDFLFVGPGRVLTLLNHGHLRLQQHLMFQVDDLTLVRVYDIQRRVHNWRSTGEGVSTLIRPICVCTNRGQANHALRETRQP